MIRHALHGPWGDSSLHLSLEELERGLEVLNPPRDAGELALIVSRGDDGHRSTPDRMVLSPERGVPGDVWWRDSPAKIDSQISIMRADIARLVANGQPLSLVGDNLLVDLDLSVSNLPQGSRLQVGTSFLEITPEPHNGCLKFRQRFGRFALRVTADRRFKDLRLRGIYAKVMEEGEIEVGDPIYVVGRS